MNYLIEVMPQLLQGALITLKLFAYTILGSLPLGILLSFGLASHFKPLYNGSYVFTFGSCEGRLCYCN